MHGIDKNRDPGGSGERRWSVKPPHPSLLALEPMRAGVELLASVGIGPLLRHLPPGDGQAVLVLPAYGASDTSTRPLRRRLRSIGYFVHGAKTGRMTGEIGTLDRIATRLLEIAARHGAPVSIIGWSLGGMYARELARRHPASVRQLILLGSPFRFRAHLGDRSLLTSLLGPARLAKLELGDLRLDEHERPAIEVPVTCIYSRTDGIVGWAACAESVGARRENIEIRGSHIGLTNNPAALIAIVDRLALPVGRWKKFASPPTLSWLYPTPRYWTAGFGEARRIANASRSLSMQ